MEVLETPKRLLVSIDEAADMMGVRRSSVYGLLSSGRLESVKIGRSRRVPVDAIEKFVQDLRAATAETAEHDA